MRHLLCVLALVACSGLSLTPKQQEAVDLFECRVAALEPYVGTVYDAADTVRQVSAGQIDLVKLMAGLGYEVEDVVKLAAELGACEPPRAVVAPPPQYGNRVL